VTRIDVPALGSSQAVLVITETPAGFVLRVYGEGAAAALADILARHASERVRTVQPKPKAEAATGGTGEQWP
jgi:hypothetical protein